MPRHVARHNGPHPIDLHVGSRVRLQRTKLGMSQSDLAEQVGLTFQQVQKYEKGMNRISASRLAEIAKVLQAPIAWFFEGASTSSITFKDWTQCPLLMELARSLMAIPDPVARDKMIVSVTDTIKTATQLPAWSGWSS